jgi:hypothetical protein
MLGLSHQWSQSQLETKQNTVMKRDMHVFLVQVPGCFASTVTINDASLKLIASACSYGLLQREALAIWAGCGTLPIVHFPLCEDKHFDLRV